MNNTRSVGCRQGVQHISHQGDRLGGWQSATLGQQLGQRLPRYILKNKIGLLLMHIGLKDRNDAGVGQATDAASLLQPLRQRSRIGPLLQFHLLDGHLTLQARIKCQPNNRLRALAQNTAQLKAPQHGGFWCVGLTRLEPLDRGEG